LFLKRSKLLLAPGANPSNVSNNAGVVKIYNATSSIERFENKNSFFYVYNMRNGLAHCTAGVVVVNFEVVGGLAPGHFFPNIFFFSSFPLSLHIYIHYFF
jgi:hypothetical protein